MITLGAQQSSLPDILLRMGEADCVSTSTLNRTALLLDLVQVVGHDLEQLMMGIGIELLHGPHMPDMEISSVLLIGGSGTMNAVTRRRLEMSRSLYPKAAICRTSRTITVPRTDWRDRGARNDDPRACLQATEIEFQELGTLHAT